MSQIAILKRPHDAMDDLAIVDVPFPGDSPTLPCPNSRPTSDVIDALCIDNRSWRMPRYEQEQVNIETVKCSVDVPVTCLALFQRLPFRPAMRLINASIATNQRFIGANGCVSSDVKVSKFHVADRCEQRRSCHILSTRRDHCGAYDPCYQCLYRANAYQADDRPVSVLCRILSVPLTCASFWKRYTPT
jgi:hypothetical protein